MKSQTGCRDQEIDQDEHTRDRMRDVFERVWARQSVTRVRAYRLSIGPRVHNLLTYKKVEKPTKGVILNYTP